MDQLRVRAMTEGEVSTLQRWARTRKGSVRLAERARVLLWAHEGWRVSALVGRLGLADATIRLWIKRFNAQGLEGLKDAPRSGRPPTYTPEQVAEVLAAALTDPKSLGLPFGSWTLDRLASYPHEERGIAMKRSRIDELLVREGLRWRTQETWFGERVDPQFAAKRGKSSGSARPRLRAV
jgi:transposase